MDLQIKNRCTLVTGSTSGIGTAIARVLAREGAKVIVHGRDESRAKQVCEEITSSGGTAAFAVGDLKTDEGATQVFKTAEEHFGQIDILVNNAGTYAANAWHQTTPDSWREFYEADVLSVVRMVQAHATWTAAQERTSGHH